MTTLATEETDGAGVPRLQVGEWVETAFDWVDQNLGSLTSAVESGLGYLSDTALSILIFPDALISILILTLLSFLVKGWTLAVLNFVLLVFIVTIDLWEPAMQTLAVVLVAAIVALVIAIPLGILAATSERISGIVRPVMDLMQTMPALVWLVPVVVLFSVGPTAAVIATLIFCLPPGARFTELGIRQVDPEVVEAGHAFGSTGTQILFRIQLPLALKTIMAGVNQVIMLALSMAVIAGFVGGGGVGGIVVTAISQLNIGLAFEGGFAVVALAIVLDRITAAIGSDDAQKSPISRGIKALRRRQTDGTQQQAKTMNA